LTRRGGEHLQFGNDRLDLELLRAPGGSGHLRLAGIGARPRAPGRHVKILLSTPPPAMPTQTSQIDRDLRDLADLGSRPGDRALRERLAAHGLELLPALEEYLTRDLPIDVLEGYEEVL